MEQRKLEDFSNRVSVYKQSGVRTDCDTDQGNVFFYVGTVWQICKNGVHVLDIGDANSQVCQPGQRPQFVLILKNQINLLSSKHQHFSLSSVCSSKHFCSPSR